MRQSAKLWGRRGPACSKKAGLAAGLSTINSRACSVPRNNRVRTAKTVIHPKRDHIHILADAVDGTGKKRIRDRERIVRITHEEVVVFDTERPVRREAVFPTDTDGTTPPI